MTASAQDFNGLKEDVTRKEFRERGIVALWKPGKRQGIWFLLVDIDCWLVSRRQAREGRLALSLT
jgi:tRNA A37 N6-isopentenylltransferase MiaA